MNFSAVEVSDSKLQKQKKAEESETLRGGGTYQHLSQSHLDIYNENGQLTDQAFAVS